ncbi:MAG TPA: glycosyltransferase family 4 protein [Gaiellaceae bacterium]|nr:glycosyltransferase family 4 protein [Gaiellaceae bacterium]
MVDVLEELLGRTVSDRVRSELLTLVDLEHYEIESGASFGEPVGALAHYLEFGAASLLDPHPLFSTAYYVAGLSQDDSAENALVHFVEKGAAAGLDPSPYFDVGYYVAQMGGSSASVNPLVHYVKHGAAGNVPNPNPLFGTGYYLAVNDDVRSAGANPFVHYMTTGIHEGRIASHRHQEVFGESTGASRTLRRGTSARATVVLALRGTSTPALAAAFAREGRVHTQLLFVRRPALDEADRLGAVVLEDHEEAGLLRPSALRLLAHALAARGVALAVTDVPDLVAGFRAAGVATYFVVGDENAVSEIDVSALAATATRLVFGSAELFRSLPATTRPVNVAVRRYADDAAAASAFTAAVLDLAAADAASAPAQAQPLTRATRTLRVVCSDWSVSGVNAALEAVAMQLVQKGWQVEILFTRDESFVRETAGGRLPDLPHRFLERTLPGVEGMWESLIRELERSAPCVTLLAYDFVANSVVPALTQSVGVAMWVQADDGDYYEQAYRLGRYCNAIVCVSQHIADEVAELHPGLTSRTAVIHNTSVSAADVTELRTSGTGELRIAYSGRLVQYQKRILDFVELADALERTGVPFRITLAGTFNAHDDAAAVFPRRAAHHLDRGTIELTGRLARDDLFETLRAHDFFVLLSDFEGLPLSVVEAMACGCVPVVADMKSGIGEIIVSGENGVVVHGRDYDEWARLVTELWRDRATLATMSQSARATIRDRFTAERIGSQFDELFSRVAGEATSGTFTRPPALHWGENRAPFGDVLPPPSVYRPTRIAGVG